MQMNPAKIMGYSKRRLSDWVGWLCVVLSTSGVVLNAVADESLDELLRQGTEYQLHGDYQQAARYGERLKRRYPESGVGQAFTINTLVTRLSWDAADTQFDDALESESRDALSLCKTKIKQHPEVAAGYHLCGQAHFALTFLYAARGSYFRAGRNATLTIKRLEQALARDPELTDAKMHLGITYYYADNLPPFVRAISRFLRFIPTGDSDKSLPYLKEATESGLYLRDVAKFLYADLIMSSEPQLLPQAQTLLADLVSRYPKNRRFQLKYMSYWAQTSDWPQLLRTIEQFGALAPLAEGDRNLVQLWRVNALLAQGHLSQARRAFLLVGENELPSWGLDWREDTQMRLEEP